MAIVKVRKNFHQARWDEPIIYEMSTHGVRGILPPEVEDEIADRPPAQAAALSYFRLFVRLWRGVGR